MNTGTKAPGRRLRNLLLPALNLFAVVLAVLGLGGTYVLYSQLRATEWRHRQQRTATELHHVSLEAQDGVLQRLQQLHSLAQWWISQGRPVDLEDWKNDSSLFLKPGGALVEARWLDLKGRTRWSVRPDQIPVAGGPPIPAALLPRLEHECRQDAVAIVSPVSDRRFFACTPAIRDGRQIGYVVGSFNSAKLLDSVLTDQLPSDYEVSIVASGVEIYRHPSSSTAPGLLTSADIRVPGAAWSLRLGLPAEEIANLRALVWAFGFLVTGFLYLTARLAQASWQRSEALNKVYGDLLLEQRERQRSEATVAELNRDLQLRLSEFQALLDVVPIGISVAADAQCHTIWTNPALAKMMGVPPGLNISKSGPDADRLPYHFLRNNQEVTAEDLPMQRAARSAREVVGDELDIVRADGRVVKTLSYSSPLFDEGGAVRGVVNACVDLTERRDLEERLQRSEKLKSLALMAGGIAHDFNNLLTAIIGHASMASDESPPESEARRHLHACLSAAERAATLVSRLLAYSGHNVHLLRSLHLSDLVGDMREEIRRMAPPPAEVRFELSQDLPPVKADPSEVRDVISSILSNAVEALAGDNGTIEVATSRCRLSAADIPALFSYEDIPPGVYVRLAISDTGCGMSPEVVRSIFDPFFTTKFTGRGLGLSAAHGIVRAHQGAIRVESSPGQGTRVEVVFPVEPPVLGR